MLSNYWTNNHDEQLSRQVMKKFVNNAALQWMKWPIEENDRLSSTLLSSTRGQQGTLASVGINADAQFQSANSSCLTTTDFSLFQDVSGYLELPDRRKSVYAECSDYVDLKSMFCALYGISNIQVHRRIIILDSVKYRDEVFRVHKLDTTSCNVIQARWLSESFPLRIDCTSTLKRCGRIVNIMLSKVVVDGNTKEYLLLKVAWYSSHDDIYHFGNHVHVYSKEFCVQGSYSYIPIQRIICKCALYTTKVNHIKRVVIIPLLGRWAIC